MLSGSVAGAAELLHVSQPAISKMLAQARKQVGFPLFERVKEDWSTPEALPWHAHCRCPGTQPGDVR